MVLRYSWEAFEEYPEVLKQVKELSFVRKQQLNKK